MKTRNVTFLDPNYPALTWPNRNYRRRTLTGWVEERGHGFMRSWDPRYTAPTETHDPDQEPQKGRSSHRSLWQRVSMSTMRMRSIASYPKVCPGPFVFSPTY